MDPMHPARKHAKYLARDLSRCGTRYIVQLSLKELGVPSGQDGFPLAKHVVFLCDIFRNEAGLSVPDACIPVCQRYRWQERFQWCLRLLRKLILYAAISHFTFLNE